MTTSRVPDVVGWLVDTFTAAVTVGGATPPVSVFCGPVLTGDFAQLALWVGSQDPPLDNTQSIVAATSNQTWVGLGARARDEDLTVWCYAEAWSGDTTTRDALTAVYGIVAAVEDILRLDANLGGNVQYINPGSTGHVLKWRPGSGGLGCGIQFQIVARARIGGP